MTQARLFSAGTPTVNGRVLADRDRSDFELWLAVRRYLKHRPSLFVFLYHSNVPFDNNASERALRNSVIHRKVSGGFRSDDGAQAHAIVSSVADTARKRDQDVLAVLLSYIGQPAPTLS